MIFSNVGVTARERFWLNLAEYEMINDAIAESIELNVKGSTQLSRIWFVWFPLSQFETDANIIGWAKSI